MPSKNQSPVPDTAPAAPGCLRSVRKAADRYGINPVTIKRWIASGLISSYQVGPKLLMVDIDEINAVMVRRVSAARDGREAAS